MENSHKVSNTDNTCPITGELIQDSIETDCGHRFEKSALIDWLSVSPNHNCPVCREYINDDIFSNNARTNTTYPSSRSFLFDEDTNIENQSQNQGASQDLAQDLRAYFQRRNRQVSTLRDDIPPAPPLPSNLNNPITQRSHWPKVEVANQYEDSTHPFHRAIRFLSKINNKLDHIPNEVERRDPQIAFPAPPPLPGLSENYNSTLYKPNFIRDQNKHNNDGISHQFYEQKTKRHSHIQSFWAKSKNKVSEIKEKVTHNKKSDRRRP